MTAALLTALAVTVTGCGIDPMQNAAPSASPALSGVIHGGPNPVVGATVTLYATQSNGYGGAGLKLASTSTSSNGSFSFIPSSYSCPAGQQAYITSAAGDTGANSANSNSLLMAAIGPCSNLSGNTQIWIDELSTVASAYALSNFITITGSGATAVVNVSAPANNNAATGSCTGTGTSMTCVAAGLPHAFLNAANLVNAVGTVSAPPNGQAYITPPSNPTTSSTAVALQNVVPQQLINTLGNIVQACVNSTGASGTNACATLFTNTTPSSTYTASPITPTNTLQAMVNLAKFPFTGTANLYNIAQSSGFYQPTLTAAPPDFSIAIIFRSYVVGAGASNQIGTVYYTTTDINDNVYATALTASSTGSILGAVPYVADAFSSNGSGIWSPATLVSTSSAAYTCDNNAGSAATAGACFAATDAAGHLYVGLGANGLSAGGLWQVSSTSGAVTQFSGVNSTANYPVALAVDRSNNLYYSGTMQNSTANLFTLPAGSTSTATPASVTTPGGGAAMTTAAGAYSGGHLSDSLVFDSAGNLFAPLASGSNDGFLYLPNTGTLTTETFGTPNQCNCLGESEGDDKWQTGGMVDASGNYWFTGQYGLYKIASGATNAPNVTGGASTGVNNYNVGSTITTTLRISSMDGAGTIFVPDNGTSGEVNEQSGPPTAPAPALLISYTPLATGSTMPNVSLQGCNVGTATGNTTCITGNQTAPNSGLFYQAVNPAIDSTGSLWVSSEGNDAIIQVIGLAAPTWPQASYLHPGVMPQ
jgi:hypothetical protein